MKYCFLSLFLFCSSLGFSQNAFDLDTVIQFSESSQDLLFVKTKEYLSASFKDASSVIEIEDKESGVLVAKGKAEYTFSKPKFTCNTANSKGYIEFTAKFLFKDGRVKLILRDFAHTAPAPANVIIGRLDEGMTNPVEGILQKCWQKTYDDIIPKTKLLRSNLVNQYTRVLPEMLKQNQDW